MNALLELKKQMEIDFLKTKTYEEINDMFNQLNDKLKIAESEVKKFRLGTVSGQSEQLIDFAIKNGYIEDMPKGNKMGLIDKFEKSINCH